MVELTLFLDVDLDQLQYISPYCFHWLQHALISSLLYSVANAFRVELINLDQILKDLAQISNILLTYTGCNFLVDFDDKIDGFDDIRSHELIGTLIGSLKNHLPVLVSVLKKLSDIFLLKVWLSRDHEADTLIHH